MRFGVVILLLLTSLTARAQGWFIDVELGRASTDVPNSMLTPDIGNVITTRIDDESNGYSLQFGYDLTERWSIAAGFVDLGEGEFSLEGDTLTPSVFAQQAARTPVLANGVTFSAMFHAYRAERIIITAELGFIRWDADLESISSVGTIRTSEQGTDFMWGASVGYALSPQWEVNAGYRAYELDERISFPHIGVSYLF